MSAYLFTALFYLFSFLLMCVTLCGQVYAIGGVPAPASEETFELFTKQEKESVSGAPEADSDQTNTIAVTNYYSPVLVKTGDVFVALAGVDRVDNNEKKVEVLTKHITKSELLTQNIVENIKERWKTQLNVQNEETAEGAKKIVKCVLAVTKKDEIYLLSVNYTTKTDLATTDDRELVVKLNFSTVTTEVAEKIGWTKRDLIDNNVISEFKEELKRAYIEDFLFSGSAFLTAEEKIVFVVIAEEKQKNFFALMQLNEDKSIEKGSVYKEIVGDCYPFFFPWDNKIFMVPVNCGENNKKKIMELSNVGDNWNNSTGAFSRQSEFLKDKKHFTIAKIGNKPVLLFTEEKAGKQNKDVNLWMSDGNRSTKVDVITTIQFAETFYGSILYTDSGVFVLYQKYEAHATGKKDINSIFFSKVKKPVEEITKTFNAWKNNDNDIQTHCKETAIAYIPCSTDGLVGYLVDFNQHNNHWTDKYFYENAFVTSKEEAKKVNDGLQFTGVGVGAKWKVGKDDKEQPYNFTDPGFTLVTTVKIEAIPKEGEFNSVLGVGLKKARNEEEADSIGLLCTDKSVWAVNKEKTTNLIESNEECGQGKTYSIIIVLNENTKLKIYVNGKEITFLGNGEIELDKQNIITHFYFGATTETTGKKTDKSHVTVTNALLYNRPFNNLDITEIKDKIKTPAKVDEPKEEKENIARKSENNVETNKLSGTSPSTNDKEEAAQSTSPPPTTEDGAARVGVVGVLCFMLFGVFTLLGRYVY